MSIPTLPSESDYNQWIMDLAREEAKEIVDELPAEDITDGEVGAWIEHSGRVIFDQRELVLLYRDVLQYTDSSPTHKAKIDPVEDDLLDIAADITQSLIYDDVIAETKHVLDLDHGIEL